MPNRLTFREALAQARLVFIMIHADGCGWHIATSKAAVKRSEAWATLTAYDSLDGESATDCEDQTLWSLYGDDLVIG